VVEFDQRLASLELANSFVAAPEVSATDAAATERRAFEPITRESAAAGLDPHDPAAPAAPLGAASRESAISRSVTAFEPRGVTGAIPVEPSASFTTTQFETGPRRARDALTQTNVFEPALPFEPLRGSVDAVPRAQPAQIDDEPVATTIQPKFDVEPMPRLEPSRSIEPDPSQSSAAALSHALSAIEQWMLEPPRQPNAEQRFEPPHPPRSADAQPHVHVEAQPNHGRLEARLRALEAPRAYQPSVSVAPRLTIGHLEIEVVAPPTRPFTPRAEAAARRSVIASAAAPAQPRPSALDAKLSFGMRQR
jgi:hypothetical protein